MALLTGLKHKAAHLLRGERAEDKALDYLSKQGLKPVCRNFRCKHGELDLIMTDQNALVFVEVRFRSSDKFGSALESVTHKKQQRIIAAAQTYLSRQQSDGPVRFDVVALSGDGSIQWVKNAF